MSSHSVRSADEALGACVRLGRPRPGQNHPHAFAAEDLVEAGDELRVAVVDQELRVAERSREAQVACLLGNPPAVRMRIAASEVHAAALKLDEEEHVVAAQERGLDGEEVTGDDAGRLRTQEVAPARPQASRRRSKASTRKQAANGARRDAEAELAELAGDALIAPARVLAREPQHKLSLLRVDRRPPGPRRAYVHRLRTSSRCQRSRVWGVTSRPWRRRGESRRLVAARKARSLDRRLGRSTCRRRTSS